MNPNHPSENIYVFLGSDRPGKLKRIKSLSKSLGVELLDQHLVTAGEMREDSLVSLAREHPIASPFKLIAIDEAQKLRPSYIEGLMNHLDSISHASKLVFLIGSKPEAENTLLGLYKIARLEQFGQDEYPKKGKDKLNSKSSRDFAVVECIARNDAAGALESAKEQLDNGKEPLELLGLLGWQIQRWLTISHLKEEKINNPHIADITGLSLWQVERILEEIKDRTPEMLKKQMALCWKLDLSAKSGKLSPRLALERMIFSLCLMKG